ncbi:MAG: hypothetical protein HY731_05050 [Candidatus Tectomicrobia bacterium]|nr:hypothetical protein [Candidatus Tectomicrobia bacterium]
MANLLLIGTNNRSKVEMYETILRDTLITVVSPKQLNLRLTVEESLSDLDHNSRLKAMMFAQASQLMALSDDMGLFIDELHGEPGPSPRRWGGLFDVSISDDEWVKFLMGRLKETPLERREATLRYSVSIASPQGDVETFQEELRGVICETPPMSYLPGFPLSGCFLYERFQKTLLEMTDQEKLDLWQGFQRKILELRPHLFL